VKRGGDGGVNITNLAAARMLGTTPRSHQKTTQRTDHRTGQKTVQRKPQRTGQRSYLPEPDRGKIHPVELMA
jgi:hypothetical protein